MREVLSEGLPARAPGQELLLLRFTFEPGRSSRRMHIHPGMQAAYVLSGTLGYTVLYGQALVTHDVPGGGNVRTEPLDPGPEVFFRPGDAFVEVDSIVHSGRNAGAEPLVLLVSSLFTDGAPPSQLVPAKQAGLLIRGQSRTEGQAFARSTLFATARAGRHPRAGTGG